MIEPPYLGPWMKFTRARTRHGFPIISVSKDGKKWTRLNPKESWDIMVALRGPDNDESSTADQVKRRTTAPIRGLFLKWRMSDMGMRAIDGGAYAVKPRTVHWHKQPPMEATMQRMSWHFTQHWKRAWLIIESYLGGWPMDVKKDDQTPKQ